MKLKALLITFFIFQLFISGSSAEKIVAVVGEVSITSDELQKRLRNRQYSSPAKKLHKNEEDKALSKLLLEMIDFELLYLQAKRENIASSPEYEKKLKAYSDSMLAELYSKNLFVRKINLSKKELREYAKENKLSLMLARASILKKKRETVLREEESRLLDKAGVSYSPTISKKETEKIKPDDIIATSKSFEIRYRDIEEQFLNLGSAREKLIAHLALVIRIKLFSIEAVELRLQKRAEYEDSMNEHRKKLLVSVFKNQLLKRFEPSDEEVDRYLSDNKQLLDFPIKERKKLAAKRFKEDKLFKYMKGLHKKENVVVYKFGNL